MTGDFWFVYCDNLNSIIVHNLLRSFVKGGACLKRTVSKILSTSIILTNVFVVVMHIQPFLRAVSLFQYYFNTGFREVPNQPKRDESTMLYESTQQLLFVV